MKHWKEGKSYRTICAIIVQIFFIHCVFYIWFSLGWLWWATCLLDYPLDSGNNIIWYMNIDELTLCPLVYAVHLFTVPSPWSFVITKEKEITTLIIDNSYSICKAGFDGDDAPNQSSVALDTRTSWWAWARKTTMWVMRPRAREIAWPWSSPSSMALSPSGMTWRRSGFTPSTMNFVWPLRSTRCFWWRFPWTPMLTERRWCR